VANASDQAIIGPVIIETDHLLLGKRALSVLDLTGHRGTVPTTDHRRRRDEMSPNSRALDRIGPRAVAGPALSPAT
jgi:hypothetical protein